MFRRSRNGIYYAMRSYWYPEIIRQYKNLPGHHVIYYTDIPEGWKGYVGLTDAFNNVITSMLVRDCKVYDMEILGDTAYFCGQTMANHPLIGWFDIHELAMGNGASPSIDTALPYNGAIENIEVYVDVYGNTIVAGYGKNYTNYYGLMYNVTVPGCNVVSFLPYKPYDMAVTDNYVVIAGMSLGNETILHPFSRNATLPSYMPYYSYTTCTATATEPMNELRVVSLVGDKVATLSYRHEGGQYWMMLREYDVSNAFVNYTLPMFATYRVKFNYSPYRIYDFLYNGARNIYTVLHNYEVSPTDYHDAVTKIDISGGIPSTVQSDYLANPIYTMTSMSSSGSNMYIAYGYKTIGGLNAFWKDYQYVTGSGCLSSDMLPLKTIATINEEIHPYSSGFSVIVGISSLPQNDPVSTIIRTICH